MKKVNRTKGIRRAFRTRVLNKPVQKFVTAGTCACSRMMFEARQRLYSGPSDRAILAWAQFDLAREILSGYWQQSTTRTNQLAA